LEGARLKGILLLTVSVVMLGNSALCAFTPIVWNLTGREEQTYPELLFLFYHLPTSALALIDAVLVVWSTRALPCRGRGRQIVWTSALLKLGALLLLTLPMTASAKISWLPQLPVYAQTLSLVLSFYHVLFLLPLLVLSATGAHIMFRGKPR
jgi:hypothetical protein